MDNILQYKTQKLFQYCQDADIEWDDGEYVRTHYSALFYQGVYGMRHAFSGYISKDAFLTRQNMVTDDHFLSPRLTFRAMMDQRRDILFDYDLFADLVNVCRTTIRITKQQNNSYDIKFRMNGITPDIRTTTLEKYDGWGWYQQGKGFLTEYVNGELLPQKFPLKHLVPEWLTTFERQYVNGGRAS